MSEMGCMAVATRDWVWTERGLGGEARYGRDGDDWTAMDWEWMEFEKGGEECGCWGIASLVYHDHGDEAWVLSRGEG